MRTSPIIGGEVTAGTLAGNGSRRGSAALMPRGAS
jgi:hypothetical protein